MGGVYEEKLPSGGTLTVSAHNWCIKYYFPGPDLRYNGTFVTVPGAEVNEYIHAWERNFEKYIELKKTIPTGGNFETNGEKGMVIRIGSFHEGVCIKSYHMPIHSRDKLMQVISDYHSADERATKIQKMLQSI